ncbi:MAG: 1-acyl-sn-glycerol-3-phosphate acyltransferase [Candidatus Heimdallarchaeota archaeon]|nr:1-acyl-sn-glycerol-3-phosphate acyltransferase [Candidatus Heimdallarchaeota archaeon]
MNNVGSDGTEKDIKVHFYDRNVLEQKLSGVFYIIGRFIFTYMFMLLFGFRIHNKKNVPRNPGYILIGNHQSHFDPMSFPVATVHNFTFAARHTLFKNAIFGKIISFMGAFPIRRGVRDNFAFKQMKLELERGNALIVFPEGTRSLDEKILNFKSGVEIILKMTKAPILPAVIQGNSKNFSKNRKIYQLSARGTMNIIFGKTISAEEYLAYPRREFMKALEVEIRRLDADLKNKPYYKCRGITTISDIIMHVINFNTTCLFYCVKAINFVARLFK